MENNGGVFLRASHLVIRFAAANEWAARGYENVRDDIEDILTNLRQFLQKSSWTALSPYDRIQLLTKMVPDSVRLERKDSGLVDRALAEILDAAASAVVPLEQFAANVKRRSKVVDGLRNLWAICDGR
ncbi:hypothetical protein AcW1_009234 [Taiwanofungus camphoratus]|nr:hypothetical protein AcV5_007258 [Antrodia cinnamomea]KAI0949706.1 hypothetical protein AcW1_009234 [Antrodia cinnamomea]